VQEGIKIISDKMAKGAIPALILLIIGIWFNLPNEANIGMMTVNALNEGLCDNSTQDNVACQQMPVYKGLFHLLGIIIIVADIAYILTALKNGDF